MIAEADSKYQKESAEQKPKKKVTPRLTKPVKQKGISPTPKGGRLSRYPNGNRRMRIPTEIADVLEPVLDRMYPPIGDGNLDVETIEKLKVFLKHLLRIAQKRKLSSTVKNWNGNVRQFNDRVIDAMLSAGISVRKKALDTDFVSDAFLDICVASLLLCFV